MCIHDLCKFSTEGEMWMFNEYASSSVYTNTIFKNSFYYRRENFAYMLPGQNKRKNLFKEILICLPLAFSFTHLYVLLK